MQFHFRSAKKNKDYIFIEAWTSATSSFVFSLFSIAFWWMLVTATVIIPRASIHFLNVSSVWPGLPPWVEKATAGLPIHPSRPSIAACIAGVGLNAHTGDPNTTRSYSDTSGDEGSIVVFSSPLAILHRTRKRVSREQDAVSQTSIRHRMPRQYAGLRGGCYRSRYGK